MRTLDTLEPGERFKTTFTGRTGIVKEQCEGSVYVKWDRWADSFTKIWNAHEERISRKTEVE